MIDIARLRKDFSAVADNLRRRGVHVNGELFWQMEEKRKAAQQRSQNLRAVRNLQSAAIGLAKATGKDATAVISQMEKIKRELGGLEKELQETLAALDKFLLHLPNVLHDSVPDGGDESCNSEVRRWGEIREFDFPPQDHVALGERLGMMDFQSAAKIAKSRFVVLSDDLSRLHRALAQFMLDLHIERHGYREMYTPYLAGVPSLRGTGQLPKFEEDLFAIPRDDLYLIPTAEVALTNLARDRIFSPDELPMKLVGHTPCFRREAGSYGKDTRGMIRQHQFEKVELVHLTAAADSYAALETLTADAEAVLRLLKIPHRTVVLCAGDVGFGAAKTYDIEAWLPGEGRYREISSCSNCEDFQARRMAARVRAGKKNEYIHTLNGSGVAVGRAMIAVMENYQLPDGRIAVPEILAPYMRGQTVIGWNKSARIF